MNSSTTDQILGEIGLGLIEVHRIRGIILIAKTPIRYRPSLLRCPGGRRRPLDIRDSVLESHHHLHLLTAAAAAVVVGMDTTETTVEAMEEEEAMAEGAMADMPRHCRRHLLTMAMEASTTGLLPHRAAVIETDGRTIMGGVTEVGAGTIDR